MKVLASAYACNPFRGSEEGVGWGWINAIARKHEVWVLTAAYHRTDLEHAMLRAPEIRERMHFVFVDEKPWHYRPTPGWIKIENSVAKPVMNWAYRGWLRNAFGLARKLHSDIGFHLAHQITYVGFRFPGHLWRLDIPFVWGPIGGLENMPWRFLPELGVGGALHYAARNAINIAHKRFLRGPRKAFAAGRPGVIAATSGIRREIERWYDIDSEVICEIGLPTGSIASTHSERRLEEPFRIAWSGLHLSRKALPILLRALASLPPQMDWRLEIFGDGSCRTDWQALASRLGLDDRCAWRGQVSREAALAGVRRAHLFVITSLQDLTSTVLIEALANGVPVICPDHCGFSDVLTPECGVKVPILSVAGFEKGLRDTILDLYRDEEKRRHMARGALRRAWDFSWEEKTLKLDLIYEKAIEVTSKKPVKTADRQIASSL